MIVFFFTLLSQEKNGFWRFVEILPPWHQNLWNSSWMRDERVLGMTWPHWIRTGRPGLTAMVLSRAHADWWGPRMAGMSWWWHPDLLSGWMRGLVSGFVGIGNETPSHRRSMKFCRPSVAPRLGWYHFLKTDMCAREIKCFFIKFSCYFFLLFFLTIIIITTVLI